MGNFYTNITLKGPTQGEVVEAMAGRTAFISPTVERSTIVFDQQCEEQLTPELAALAARLSEHLRCPALAAMNHDDDILWLQFFQNGSSLGGEYVSAPGYFTGQDMPPSGGDAGAIATGFGMPGAAPDVERVLHQGSGEDGYTFAIQRHSDLLHALKLPEFASAVGFTYLSEGEFPDGLTESDFIRIA
jgi:hypothetical protein